MQQMFEYLFKALLSPSEERIRHVKFILKRFEVLTERPMYSMEKALPWEG